jgi:hypothetical protein
MKKKNIILEQNASFTMDDGAKLKMANEKGCYPKWLKGGQLGNYKGKKTWYGKNDKGETVCFYADMTAENIQTKKTSNWSCDALSQTAGVTQDITKVSSDNQAKINAELAVDPSFSTTKPLDYDQNPKKYVTKPIEGTNIILYKQSNLDQQLPPDSTKMLETHINSLGWTTTVPKDIKGFNSGGKLGTKLTAEEQDGLKRVLGLTNLNLDMDIYPIGGVKAIEIQNRADAKTERQDQKAASKEDENVMQCVNAIRVMFNSYQSFLGRSGRRNVKINPDVKIIGNDDTKTNVEIQQELDAQKRVIKACAGKYGSEFSDDVSPFRLREKGLANDADELYRQLTRITKPTTPGELNFSLKESHNVDLKKVIRENLISIQKNNKKVLTEESKIVKNRFKIIGEGRTIKTKKDRIKLSDELINEMVYLNSQGFNKQVINESFWDLLTGLFPKGVDSIFDTFKERGIAWLMEKVGLNPNSWLGSVVVTGLGDIDIVDIPKLFSDCNFATKVMSKAIAEGTVRQLQQKYTSDSAVADILRNTVVEVLSETELGQKLESAIGSLICPLISNLSEKLKSATSEITDKAVGAKEDSGMLSKLGLS